MLKAKNAGTNGSWLAVTIKRTTDSVHSQRGIQMKLLSSLTVIVLLGNGFLFTSTDATGQSQTLPKVITVPEVQAGTISIDGLFAKGEWDSAAVFRLSQNIRIYMLVNSGYLYVGFNYMKPCVDTFSELYLTINEREFINFHASGSAWDGVNAFAPDLKTAASNGKSLDDWNVNARASSGRYENAKAREYKIGLNMLTGKPLKMAGVISVILNNTGTERETVSFPEESSFINSTNWIELIVPKIQ